MSLIPTYNSIPSGFTESEVDEVIEQVAHYKACQYTPVGYFEYDDLRQEVRIKCMQTLARFNRVPTKENLSRFLSVCADNKRHKT